MRHPSIRELFDYWSERRGRRPAPDRSDIEPGAIRRALPDTFIFTVDKDGGHPFRIAGTRVCALFGRELKGEAFLKLWAADSRDTMRELVAIVSQESVGLVAGASGRSADGDVLDLELLALPLGHAGRPDARVLGALAPAEVPYWIGVSALGHLALDTLRYVGPTLMPKAAPRMVPPLAQGRLRRGLVVYDGG